MKGGPASRVGLAKALLGLRSFLIAELRTQTYVWGDVGGNVTLTTTPSTLQQNGTDMALTVTFPASGRVQFTIEATVYPTTNDSGVIIGLRQGGTSQQGNVALIPVGTPKGRYSATNVITGQPFTTQAYTVGGFYFGGTGGAAFTASVGGGEPFVVTLQPIA